MLGPYHAYIKSRGTRGTEMSSNSAIITMETYVQQMFGRNGNDKINISADILLVFVTICRVFANLQWKFLIEVWRNTLLRLVVTVLL